MSETTEERLARIETKLDSLIERVVDDHEARLRGLEKWRYSLPVALLLAAGSVLTSLTVAILQR